jgi:hypothetical protein
MYGTMLKHTKYRNKKEPIQEFIKSIDVFESMLLSIGVVDITVIIYGIITK